MTAKEFNDALKTLSDNTGAKFPEQQKEAWYARLRNIQVDEFRKIINALIETVESLPIRWNLVAAVKNFERTQPIGKAATFETKPLTEFDYEQGLKNARKFRESLRGGKCMETVPEVVNDIINKMKKEGKKC